MHRECLLLHLDDPISTDTIHFWYHVISAGYCITSLFESIMKKSSIKDLIHSIEQTSGLFYKSFTIINLCS